MVKTENILKYWRARDLVPTNSFREKHHDNQHSGEYVENELPCGATPSTPVRGQVFANVPGKRSAGLGRPYCSHQAISHTGANMIEFLDIPVLV